MSCFLLGLGLILAGKSGKHMVQKKIGQLRYQGLLTRRFTGLHLTNAESNIMKGKSNLPHRRLRQVAFCVIENYTLIMHKDDNYSELHLQKRSFTAFLMRMNDFRSIDS